MQRGGYSRSPPPLRAKRGFRSAGPPDRDPLCFPDHFSELVAPSAPNKPRRTKPHPSELSVEATSRQSRQKSPRAHRTGGAVPPEIGRSRGAIPLQEAWSPRSVRGPGESLTRLANSLQSERGVRPRRLFGGLSAVVAPVVRSGLALSLSPPQRTRALKGVASTRRRSILMLGWGPGRNPHFPTCSAGNQIGYPLLPPLPPGAVRAQ